MATLAASEKIYRGLPVGGFSSLDRALATRRLRALDASVSLEGLGKLRSVGLHRLKGERKQWAIGVNGPWRICFEFRNGDAYDVEVVNYHKG